MLLALSAKLFDPVPLEQMDAAEQAVRSAASEIPAEVLDRLASAKKLDDADRALITQIASQALIASKSLISSKTLIPGKILAGFLPGPLIK